MSMCFNAKPPKQKYNYKVRKSSTLSLTIILTSFDFVACFSDCHPVVCISMVKAYRGPSDGECGLWALEHQQGGAGGVWQRAEEVGG